MSMSSSEHASADWPHPASDVVRAGGAYAPGAAFPDPAAPFGPTIWAEGTDRGRTESADGTSSWGAPDLPAVVPEPVAGVEGPHTRPGWLLAGRDGDGPGAA